MKETRDREWPILKNKVYKTHCTKSAQNALHKTLCTKLPQCERIRTFAISPQIYQFKKADSLEFLNSAQLTLIGEPI